MSARTAADACPHPMLLCSALLLQIILLYAHFSFLQGLINLVKSCPPNSSSIAKQYYCLVRHKLYFYSGKFILRIKDLKRSS
jgi:hypothetical protein